MVTDVLDGFMQLYQMLFIGAFPGQGRECAVLYVPLCDIEAILVFTYSLF